MGTKAEGGMARRQFVPVVVKHVCPNLPEILMDVSRWRCSLYVLVPVYT